MDQLESFEKIIRSSSIMALKGYQNYYDPTTSVKGVQDYFSQIDQDVETHLIDNIKKLTPQISILSEESGGQLNQGEGYIIDPIDGSENFIRKIPLFAICLSYIKDYQVQWSMIYNPVTDEFFQGIKGKGASLNKKPIKVSSTSELKTSCLGIGFSYRRNCQWLLKVTDEIVKNQMSFRLMGSGALGLAYVACGRIDGFFEEHLNIWDFIHSFLLINEAGGYHLDFNLEEAIQNGAIGFATNQKLKETYQNIIWTAKESL